VPFKTFSPQDAVMCNRTKITCLTRNRVRLTEREVALLAVAVTEMIEAGHDPYNSTFVIQVVPWLTHVVVKMNSH